ncbi:hypothetical protein VOLCADRAFT_92051 [Volvox carteri f. nagariensis]|uniref:Uncharacterized protein n=1 Tax=Volvox carteri f. nagariensis TaxID=3068 RepID=D8TYZ5_VOLCA|nr:uncharacterized protein VOLCADRAFT_92051 [Volvox carteri f. nagariensis]EFJ47304.1 hypothetical protein VOLCADRAFT_92051 [Volvox carteri f. nagariensis]|eukprot:XP_002951493.1 hypothetical protein VOLCADRAFT_92051 [Volvox carteri f. nagariensis]
MIHITSEGVAIGPCDDPTTGCGFLFTSLVKAALEAAPAGASGILAFINPNYSPPLAPDNFASWVEGAGYDSSTITFLSNATQIAFLDLSLYKLLYIPAASRDESARTWLGGTTDDLNDDLAAVRDDIAAFVNMGGSLMVSSQFNLAIIDWGELKAVAHLTAGACPDPSGPSRDCQAPSTRNPSREEGVEC